MTNRLFTANRKYPNLPNVGDDVASHTTALRAVVEALAIHERRTKDLGNSFVRVQELVDMGLISIDGTVFNKLEIDLADLASLSGITPSEGQFLRWRTDTWVNDGLDAADITAGFVTQHQAALSINWSQITSTPTTVSGYGIVDAISTSRQVNTATGLAGGGDLSTNRTIALDINALTALTAVDPTGDYLLIYDASASAHKKVHPDDLGIVGSGGGGASAMTDLIDVSIYMLSAGDTLVYDGYNWVNEPRGSTEHTLHEEIMIDGPIGFWPCDDAVGSAQLKDWSGNGYDLTLTGSYTLESDYLVSTRPRAKFIRWGTGSSYASRSDVLGQTMPNTGDYTIEVIVRPASISSAQALFAFMAAGETEATNYQAMIGISSTGALRTFWESGAGTNQEVTSSIPLTLSRVWHLTVVKDGTANVVDFYINGIWVKQTSYSTEPTGGSSAITYLGANPTETSIDGTLMAYAAYFNKKLTADRIYAHARAAGF